jgi:hypothetical protein
MYCSNLKESVMKPSRRKTIANPGVSPDIVLHFLKWLGGSYRVTHPRLEENISSFRP